MMESSLALGRLELAPSSAPSPALGVNLGPLVKDKCCPRPQVHLNGCVPLSHQVAGHKYGVDKVGE